MLYALKADGLSTVDMRMENTPVSAFCRKESADRPAAERHGIRHFDAQP